MSAPDGKGDTAETLSPIISEDIEKAAAALLKDCCSAELTLATAESCTGGLLASLLTDVEGASHAFERGFVVYREDAQCEFLGIRSERIEARSEEHTSEPQSPMRISSAHFCLNQQISNN